MDEITLLIVEDESIVAEDLRQMLTGLGYAVTGVSATGEWALELVARRPPDLVLMDIMLKGELNGIETARIIRERHQVPVIFLTAYADARILEQAKLTEPFGYILKPYEERMLVATIEMAIYKHGMERKLREHERQLAEEKERLKVTIQSIGDAVIATDTHGCVTLMNRVAEELTGWAMPEAQGRPIVEIFHIINEHTRQVCDNPVRKVLDSGKIVGLANHTALIARDGTERIIADSGSPIRDARNAVIGVVLVFRDITTQSRMEAELVNIQRLEALGILAGGIAHDFNNLLLGIQGNLSLAQVQTGSDPPLNQLLKSAETALTQARALTQQLLTFASGGVPCKRVLAINELLEDAVQFALHGSHIQRRFALAPDLFPIEADEGQLRQVVSNLVINALQAMPDGGDLTVSAENLTIGETETVPLDPGDYVRISVRDQGIGIPEKYLARLFDPFFTTKQKGSGLGLAVTYSIIKRHDGHITVESQLGRGTTFALYLPANRLAEFTLAPEPTAYQGRGSLLVVDDDVIVCEAVQAMLSYLGFTVTLAYNGDSALAAFQASRATGHPFTAVMLDLTLPGGMNGETIAKRLLELDSAIPIIISSGYADNPMMAHYAAYGCRAAIAKPYSLAELRDVLKATLGEPVAG